MSATPENPSALPPIHWRKRVFGLTFALERTSFYPYERPYSPVFWKVTLPGLRFHGAQLMSALKRPWFNVRAPHGFGVLTVTGRRTGKRRSMCVRAIESAGKIYLIALAGERSAWLKNIRADPHVQLRVTGKRISGRARVLNDGAEFEQGRSAYCERLNSFDYVECVIHRPGVPSAARIADLHRGWFVEGTPVVIEPDRAGAS
ncbi:MAG: nitroreductase family deazaflavin-dependent oxidoreductase [Solirubrobacteraceae bacterium]